MTTYKEEKARKDDERMDTIVEFNKRLLDVNLHKVMAHDDNANAKDNPDGMIKVSPEASHHSVQEGLRRLKKGWEHENPDSPLPTRSYLVTAVANEVWLADVIITRKSSDDEPAILVSQEMTVEEWFAMIFNQNTASLPISFVLKDEEPAMFSIVFAEKV